MRLGHGLAQLLDNEYVSRVVGAEHVVTRFQLLAVARRLEPFASVRVARQERGAALTRGGLRPGTGLLPVSTLATFALGASADTGADRL